MFFHPYVANFWRLSCVSSSLFLFRKEWSVSDTREGKWKDSYPSNVPTEYASRARGCFSRASQQNFGTPFRLFKIPLANEQKTRQNSKFRTCEISNDAIVPIIYKPAKCVHWDLLVRDQALFAFVLTSQIFVFSRACGERMGKNLNRRAKNGNDVSTGPPRTFSPDNQFLTTQKKDQKSKRIETTKGE